MVTKGAKVIVVGAIDGSQLGTQLKAAKDAGATVIAYDRLVKNTPAVDYYVAYDNFKVGELQGQALLDGMAKKKAERPVQHRALLRLAGRRERRGLLRRRHEGAQAEDRRRHPDRRLRPEGLQPDRHPGLEGRERAEAHGHAARRAPTRAQTLDGVLSPNDTLARAIITSVKAAGKPVPVVTGQDSEVESVKSIMAGEQYSTINKDTRNLVKETIAMVTALQKGADADRQRHQVLQQRCQGRPGQPARRRSS